MAANTDGPLRKVIAGNVVTTIPLAASAGGGTLTATYTYSASVLPQEIYDVVDAVDRAIRAGVMVAS